MKPKTGFTRWVDSFRPLPGTPPLLSLRKGGTLGFNRAAVEAFGLAEYRLAVLYFDKTTARVGMRLTNCETEPGAKRLWVRNIAKLKMLTGTISAVQFCKAHGLLVDRAVSVPLIRNESDGMLVADFAPVAAQLRVQA